MQFLNINRVRELLRGVHCNVALRWIDYHISLCDELGLDVDEFTSSIFDEELLLDLISRKIQWRLFVNVLNVLPKESLYPLVPKLVKLYPTFSGSVASIMTKIFVDLGDVDGLNVGKLLKKQGLEYVPPTTSSDVIAKHLTLLFDNYKTSTFYELQHVWRSFFPGPDLYELIDSASYEVLEARCSLAPLSPFLLVGTPIGRFEEVIFDGCKQEAILSLLKDTLSSKLPAAKLRILAATTEALCSCGEDGAIEHVNNFALSAALWCFLDDSFDWKKLSLEDTLDCLEVKLFPLPKLDELEAHLSSFPLPKLQDVMVNRLLNSQVRNKELWSPDNLIASMKGRASPSSLQYLLTYLEEEEMDLKLQSIVASVIISMGPSVEPQLLDAWHKREAPIKSWLGPILSVIGGEATVDHFVSELHSRRACLDKLKDWCETVRHRPHKKFLTAISKETRRKLYEVDELLAHQCLLLDECHPRLETALSRVHERIHRIDVHNGGRNDVTSANTNTLTLEFRCTLCGDENRYAISKAIVKLDNKSKPLVKLPDTPPCLSCGRKSELEALQMNGIALFAELAKKEALGPEYCGPLQLKTPNPPPERIDSGRLTHRLFKKKKRSKVGRNSPCPCGSGKKYKKCCLNFAED